MRTITFALAAVVAIAAPASAQAVISQGMTTQQVRAAFGAPATTRESGPWTYWYYLNGCAVRCGSDDVVFFRDQRVVAAVLRTRRRTIAGPRADDALEQAGGAEQNGTAGTADGRAVVGGMRVDGPGERVEVIVVPGDAPPRQDDGVSVRESRPGEAPTIVIGGTAGQTAPGGVSTTVFPRAASPALPAGTAPAATAADAPASIDRANQRLNEDRANEENSLDRAARRRVQDQANEESSADRAARRNAGDRGASPTVVEAVQLNQAQTQPAVASPTVVPTPAVTPAPAAAPAPRPAAQPVTPAAARTTGRAP